MYILDWNRRAYTNLGLILSLVYHLHHEIEVFLQFPEFLAHSNHRICKVDLVLADLIDAVFKEYESVFEKAKLNIHRLQFRALVRLICIESNF